MMDMLMIHKEEICQIQIRRHRAGHPDSDPYPNGYCGAQVLKLNS